MAAAGTRRSAPAAGRRSVDDTRSEDYRVAHATAPSPTGPFTNRGLILNKEPDLGILGTGHSSVLQAPGTDDWYLVQHRFAIPAGTARTGRPRSTGRGSAGTV